MATVEQRLADLEARLQRIEKSPKVKPYIDGSNWPRPMSVMEGTTSTGLDDKAAFEAEVPRPKELIAAEEAAALAQVTFDRAQNAWMAASRPDSGMMLHQYRDGSAILVGQEDGYNNDIWSGRPDIPEYALMVAAEEALIAARVRMYKEHKRRTAAMQAWELKRNPVANPHKEEAADGPLVRITRWGKR